MDSYLIDTDVIIDHLRGKKLASDFLKKLKAEGCTIFYSVITKAEIYSGVRSEEEEIVADLLKSLTEISIDGEIAEAAGRYKSRFHASHSLLLPDALIAACAKKVSARLITLNIKHFPMKDIEIQVPYQK